MDGRRNNVGTKGNKGGRPSKAEEQKLIENLTPINKTALKALERAVKADEGWAVKLFFEYFYGKPKQQMDITTNGDNINIPKIDFFGNDKDK